MITTSACTIVSVERQLTAVVKTEVPMAKIPEAQRAIRPRIKEALRSLPLGLGVTLWRVPGAGRLYMEPGFLVPRAFEPVGDVVSSVLPTGRTAHFTLVGSFERLPGAWDTLLKWCAKESLALTSTNWEIYGDPPADPARQMTELYALLA